MMPRTFHDAHGVDRPLQVYEDECRYWTRVISDWDVHDFINKTVNGIVPWADAMRVFDTRPDVRSLYFDTMLGREFPWLHLLGKHELDITRHEAPMLWVVIIRRDPDCRAVPSHSILSRRGRLENLPSALSFRSQNSSTPLPCPSTGEWSTLLQNGSGSCRDA